MSFSPLLCPLRLEQCWPLVGAQSSACGAEASWFLFLAVVC